MSPSRCIETAREFFHAWWVNKPLCNCVDSDKLLEQNPMLFDSPKSFFDSGVRLHNAVSAKPELAASHPQVTLDEAYKLWKPNNVHI